MASKKKEPTFDAYSIYTDEQFIPLVIICKLQGAGEEQVSDACSKLMYTERLFIVPAGTEVQIGKRVDVTMRMPIMLPFGEGGDVL